MEMLTMIFVGIIICLLIIYITLFLYNLIREILRDIFKQRKNTKKIDQGYINHDTERKST